MKQFIPQLTPTRRLLLIALVSVAPFFALMFEARSERVAPWASLNLVVNTLADNADVNPGDSICDSDAGTSGSQCTLRAAIQEANAVAGDDAISFDAGLEGFISLLTPLPDLTSNLTITGPGASTLTVQRDVDPSALNYRIFTIPAGVTINVSGLTLRNGSTDTDGGAILNAGTLTITDCVLSINRAISSGGAIFSTPTGVLTISRTTLQFNIAIAGAAILSQGTMTLVDSTVTGNTQGSAIFLGGGPTTIANSTISNNFAQGGGGGLFITGGPGNPVSIVNSTITHNFADTSGSSGGTGAGILILNSDVKLRNTIVAGNFRGFGFIADDISGSVNSASSFNLIGTGGSGGLTNGVNNNKVGIANPGLGALGDYGGPTQTHRLILGSPAVDAGDNCVLTNTCSPAVGVALNNDQRGTGFARAVNGDGDNVATVDIGAYEAQSPPQDSPLVVTNTNDSGPGSLRNAILNASLNGPDNLVVFAEGLTGAITLQTALPDISFPLVINGPGPDKLTVQSTNAFFAPLRIFKIDKGAVVKISGLTISKGQAGGATIDSGSGGGIFNEGTLTIDNCNITGNAAGLGGGVANRGSLTILNSTIANNISFSHGGGVGNLFVDGGGGTTLRIDGSTIWNNTATQTGGGIYNVGSSATLITNTTISTNTAVSGGGIVSSDPLSLSSVTITANTATVRGGGIQNNGATLRFNNTIIAGNTSPTGPDCDGFGFTSEDYNLIGNTNGFQLGGVVTHNVHNVNPKLGPLANNGGPTRTHELLDGSPALDAGSSTLLTDQRGRPRKVDQLNVANAVGGEGSDIGAYEAASFEVNSTADTSDGACTLPGTGNGCTLREAMNAANTAAGFQAITFATSLTSGGPTSITLLSELPFISSDLNITGPGRDLLTVKRSSADGTSDFRIFSIGNFRTVTISDLTIANGRSLGSLNGGAGVTNLGNLTLMNCNIYGNTATNVDGGGILNTGVLLTIKNCNIGGLGPGQGNVGAGILNATGTVVMIGGSIAGNTGAGITMSGTTTLDGVAITNNIGSGIWNSGQTKVINSLIANNAANTDGGGIRNTETLTVVNTTISGNTSTGSGGGIHNFNGSFTLTNVTITNNRADSDNNSGGVDRGGGIDATSGGSRLDNTIVVGNSFGSSQSPVANDIRNTNGNPASSFNVVGVCQSCGMTDGVNNNQVGVSDAGLAPLADNGGPTLTHALLPTSPALDRGDNSLVVAPTFTGPPFTDQRGTVFSRIVDGPDGDATATVDVGAFEQQVGVAQIPNVSTKEDTQLVIPFDVGDRSSITSITVTSSNQTVLPDDPAHLRLTDAGSTELITINPFADRSGTADVTVTIVRSGGNESRTFTVTVDAVNDAPAFLRGVNQNFDEDSGVITILNWATNISAGPADESAQTLTFQVTGNTNPGLFTVAPSVSPTGTLSYTLAPNANGVALITIVLKDNGGTANGGQDTSVAQTFAVTVNSINDAPVNTIPFNANVIENGVLTLSSANANQVAVSDVDSALLRVSLSTTQGLMTLSRTTGLAFTLGDGTGDNVMLFVGTIANINAALNGMTFVPTPGFDGTATIQIVTSDSPSNVTVELFDIDNIDISVQNGGALRFLSSAVILAEGTGTATIAVIRANGSAGAASVTYSTSSGTAVGGNACGAGVDFINTTGTLSWTAGETTPKTFTVTLCNDTENEEDEVFNLTLSAPQGSGALGSPSTATVTLANDDLPVLLTEESTEQAIALTSVATTRDPFSLLDPFNLSDDHRRRVSLFVWRLGLLPSDTAASLTVTAEDNVGMTYPLTVEHVGAVPGVPDVSQVIVILPDNVIGAPRELWLRVKLRGPATNRASIRIAAP